MKPVIKYRGGKGKEIPLFEKHIPTSYKTYYEPFVGGGAVFFHLEPQKAVINDINAPLMAFYEELKTQYPLMKEQLSSIQKEYDLNQAQYRMLKAKNPKERVPNLNEDLYYRLRDKFNHPDDSYLPGVLYFFINKTAYSGMIRYNSKGEYNVPFGRYPNFNTEIITDEHQKLLSRTTLFTGDYKKLFEKAQINDFMFLDPPYDCIFHDYGNFENSFNEEDHLRLAEDFKNLSCKALMIIGKTPLTSKLYSKYIVDEYGKHYAVNIRNRFNQDAVHFIVKNY